MPGLAGMGWRDKDSAFAFRGSYLVFHCDVVTGQELNATFSPGVVPQHFGETFQGLGLLLVTGEERNLEKYLSGAPTFFHDRNES